ncbi:MAG: 1-phosphofructokinase [Clostridium sp.]|nr:1-phosphofructokinase [Clostridium sp.]
MIITVTMNPAMDRTVEIDKLCRGGLNRIQKIEYDAGGKGINVSKTIRALGGESIATGFLGGNAGRAIASALEERGIVCDAVWVDGETRTNTKIVEKDSTVTELNEPGPEVSGEQLELLMKKLEGYAGKGTLFVLSGSVPAGVDKGIYGGIIRMAHEKGGAALLDAEGELFRIGMEAGPDMIKPNRAELEEYAGYMRRASKEELLAIAKSCQEKGVKMTAVSMGEEGALFVGESYRAYAPAIPVKARSTVGAGDAMAAALALSWNRGLVREELIRLCMTAASGAVTTEGTKPPSRELVEKLQERVQIIDMY